MILNKRPLYLGDMFLNANSKQKDIFVLTKRAGQFAIGISFNRFQGHTIIVHKKYLMSDLHYNTDDFPLVGHIDLEKMWTDAIASAITDKSFLKN